MGRHTLRDTAAAGGEDSRFFRTWGIVYGLWFLALPITAVLARVALAPYAWFVTSVAVKKGMSVLVYASLVAGLWPSNMSRTPFKMYFKMLGFTSDAGREARKHIQMPGV